jgi:hypothetical protein
VAGTSIEARIRTWRQALDGRYDAKLARGFGDARRYVSAGVGRWRRLSLVVRVSGVAGVERIVLSTRAVLNGITKLVGLLALALLGITCAHPSFFPGTTILRSEDTQNLVDTIDQYRTRLAARNVDGLIVMASEKYREDSGTPRSDDDYGYEGLRQVLKTRLSRVKSIWYEIEMRDIRIRGQEADVDVFLNGSFELAAQSGDRYRRVNDYHRFVLERYGDRWKFLSGM